MGALVTIFSPDGTRGQIPQQNVQAALQAGGQVAVPIYAPDGTPGYVPQSKLGDAIHAGASTSKPAPLSDNPNGEGTYKMSGANGTVSVPFSKVPYAQNSGLTLASDDAPRFQKDANAARPGFFSSLGAQFGLDPASLAAAGKEDAAHPVETLIKKATGPAGQIATSLYGQAKQSGGELIDAGKSLAAGNPAEATVHAVGAVPIVGPALVKAATNAPLTEGSGILRKLGQTVTDPATMGTLVGASAQAAPLVAGGIDKLTPDALPAVANAIRQPLSAAKAYARPASSAAIVAPEEIQAQKIAQSILPPGGIKPEFVQAIQAEAPAVAEYAQRTGNPLNTQAEGLKAAQGVAQEGLEHYQTQVLQPVAGRTVSLDPANTELGQQATIGDIDSRITKLNKLVNTAPANSAGAALDVLAKSKWTDEAAYLRSKLYPALEQTTGIPAADIQQLREGYGGEFSLANNLEAAQNARLTRTGQAAQGQQTIAGQVPTSLADLPMKAANAMRGGEQAISDRQFASAMKGVQPQAPIRPVPPPIDTDAITANQQAAQQEFLRQQQLEQASQDSAAGRSQAVQTYRGEQSASQRAQAQQEFLQSQLGEQAAQDASAQRGQQASAARTDNQASNAARWASQGYANVVQHLTNDPSSGIARSDLIKLGQTPQGNSLLTRASSLTPGSPAMRSLVNQIKSTIGVTQ